MPARRTPSAWPLRPRADRAVRAGLPAPGPLRGGAVVLLVTVGALALLRARVAGWFRSAEPVRSVDPLTGLADAAALRPS
jgi:hypothetical protein